MVCKNCGNEYKGMQCPYCGNEPVQEDKPNVLLVILSVLFPIAGVVLFFVYRNKQPKAAMVYLFAAIISRLIGRLLLRTMV